MKTAWGLTGQPDACGGDESRVLPIVWRYLGLIFMLILLPKQHGVHGDPAAQAGSVYWGQGREEKRLDKLPVNLAALTG